MLELLVFGSFLREDFRPDSDIDFLVLFEAGAEKPARGHFLALEADLTRLLGRQSDLVSKRAVEQTDDLPRRERILGAALQVFSAEALPLSRSRERGWGEGSNR